MNTTLRQALISLACVAGMAGCQAGSNDISDTRGIALDPTAVGQNQAGIYTLSDEWLRKESLDDMEGWLKDPRNGFQVERADNISASEVIERVKKLAAGVGPRGTLLVYVNGHGGGGRNFTMSGSAGGNLRFSAMLKAIASVKTVPRLVTFIDSCGSEGGLLEAFGGAGQSASGAQSSPSASVVLFPGLKELPDQWSRESESVTTLFEPSGSGVLATKDGMALEYGQKSGAYEQALVISSDVGNESSTRGELPRSLRKAFEAIGQQGSNATVAEFLKELGRRSSSNEPRYKALPNNAILGEPMFGAAPGTGPGPSAGIAVALAPSNFNAPGMIEMRAASSAVAASMGVCMGTPDVCVATGRVDFVFDGMSRVVGDRRVFTATRGFSPVAAAPYTFVARSATGQVVAAERVVFFARQ